MSENYTTPDFKDHFSAQAPEYGRFRPDSPAALFAWLAANAHGRGRALDVATGSGQCVRALAGLFDEVIASDAGAAQIAAAAPVDGVSFRVAPAEASGVDAASVDLVTAAQAAHWFDSARFNAEARRVLRRRGLLAIWCFT